MTADFNDERKRFITIRKPIKSFTPPDRLPPRWLVEAKAVCTWLKSIVSYSKTMWYSAGDRIRHLPDHFPPLLTLQCCQIAKISAQRDSHFPLAKHHSEAFSHPTGISYGVTNQYPLSCAHSRKTLLPAALKKHHRRRRGGRLQVQLLKRLASMLQRHQLFKTWWHFFCIKEERGTVLRALLGGKDAFSFL